MPPSPAIVDQPPPPLARANSVISLYQSCLNLIERLAGVPGFDQYLTPEILSHIQAGPPSAIGTHDPVSQLWALFRLGEPLACIYNALRPRTPLQINNADLNRTGKAWVFHFLVGCWEELQIPKEESFTISELYQDDTNGFVKVIKTVSTILDRMEAQGLLAIRRSKRNSDPIKPTDHRAMVVNEILETERIYVQDLENLQAYMRALQSDGTIISLEMIHLIFGNLNALVDFQRRFLIAIETHAAYAVQDQNFGLVFSQHYEAFSVYAPFCANFAQANKLVLQEKEKLKKLNHFGPSDHAISSQLIKPVQRICKYPLFMHELVKLTDPEHPYYRDLIEGQQAIKQVTENINEMNRRQENARLAQDLQHQVAWKDGELVSDFGALLIHDTLLNPRGSSDTTSEVYLFEKILVCCQEIGSKKKSSKTLGRNSKPKPTLKLNGRICINNIKTILPVSSPGSFAIHVSWKVTAVEEFELRFPTEEQLKRWYSVLDMLVQEAHRSAYGPTMKQIDMNEPLYDNHPSFYCADDDDYFEEDIDAEDDDGYEPSPTYRSNSFGLGTPTFGSGSRLRSKTEDGSSLPHVTEWAARAGTGRPPPLPPFPRATSSSSTAMGVMSPGECPYSPPASYPASPTVSNPRGSGGSSTWQRRSNGEGHSPMNETMFKFMTYDGSDDTPGSQPLVRHGSAGYSYNATPAPPVPSLPTPLRVRAQSSPNIHASASPSWHNAPELPKSPSHNRRPSNSSGRITPSSAYSGSTYQAGSLPNSPSTESGRTLRQQTSNGALGGNTPTHLKIKVNYQEDSYLIAVPVQCGYAELIERVEKKIRLCGSRRSDAQTLRLRYKDEDNDYIIMKDDDDISLAFESCFTDGIMNLHVS
ncbi:hypothetical protein CPC16_002436 [Podila verticillata]|nr:hypothetical protein BGZ52_011363 [Haplosporangium bisporale]KAF9205106.1 hypothetical protein BGZ59_000680 [Podila verticillata]KAF9393261.1 hypothetical protein CPC16_002436 [Podila verticillata]KFH70242.1 hypothetical protein MVEG_03093 [Podila verticillata NRRL 6337]